MKKRERDLLDRLDAHLRGLDRLPALARQAVKDAWPLIDGDSWLECLLLGQALSDRINEAVGEEVERLHCVPPRKGRGKARGGE